MTIWSPQIENRKGPRYLAIADAIGEAIREGELQPDERLPTHRDLAYQLGVTVGTVSRAYAEAVRRDLVIGEVGRGTYVKPLGEANNPFHIPYDVRTDIYDFGLNFPAEGNRVDKLRQSLMTLAQDPGLGALMRYQSERGMPHHREAMAKWARHHNVPAHADNIVISNGVQHAMTLSLMTLCKAGDTLLTEEYSYPGIKTLASQLGLKMLGLRMDEKGLIPASLEEAVQTTNGRVLYLMPNYQNPTSICMPLDRRKEIADIAKKYGVWIVEDDIYGFLSEDVQSLTPLASLVPEQTFYLNGSSKSVSPGLRVGFVHAPSQKVDTVAACMRLSCWMAAPLNVEIAYRWIEDGSGFELMRWHRDEAIARQALMNKHLAGFDVLSTKGSYHSWWRLPDPWTAQVFAQKAMERNVAIMPSQVFAVGRKPQDEAVRLCFGAIQERQMVDGGVAILKELVSEEVHAFHSVI